ncbi:MAG: MotA/TolQ/ExbB proton channel family protein, partial [Candidatus Babeliales bacterium]
GCWTVFFYKIFAFRAVKQQLLRVRQLLLTCQSVENLKTVIQVVDHMVAGVLLQEGINKLFLLAYPQGLDLFKDSLDQTIDELIAQQEDSLPLLSASAAVSPLLGLFGTVWGLVHSFISISQSGAADIATIAPGIAEALITTLVGLVVAVPALLMYHVLRLYVQTIDQQLMALKDRLLHIVHLSEYERVSPSIMAQAFKNKQGTQL